MKQNIQIRTCPTCGHEQISRPANHLIEQRRKAAMALASHLVFALNIQQGKELVFVLGQGHERDSRDAVANWVLNQISYITRWPLPSDEVHELITDLEQKLGDILADIDHGVSYV